MCRQNYCGLETESSTKIGGKLLYTLYHTYYIQRSSLKLSTFIVKYIVYTSTDFIMRMYIIFSVTFSGMLSQFLNSGKLGTFQSTDGRSGWSSLLLIKFFIMIAQQMKKVMVYIQIFFFCRHLYKPLLRRGVSKQVASVAVFATSAFFHEVCTGILRLMPQTYWY